VTPEPDWQQEQKLLESRFISWIGITCCALPWGQVSRLEQQAYAGLDAVEERAAQFSQSQTTKRLEKHLSVWESLSAKTQEKIVQPDQFSQLAQQVDDQFALIDLNNGQLRDPLASAAVLRSVGMQLSHWQGHIYEKLSANLTHWADGLFAYHPGLSQALQILTNLWGAEATRLCRVCGKLNLTRNAILNRSSTDKTNRPYGKYILKKRPIV
jgi:hypothetical protein